jgi:hypothetical protein
MARSLARKNGDVDWDMFVRVLQTRGDMTEGEAVEKLQRAWRMFSAKKIVAAMRSARALAPQSKPKKNGKTGGKRGKKSRSLSKS